MAVSFSLLPSSCIAGLFGSDVGGGRKEGRKRQCRTGWSGRGLCTGTQTTTDCLVAVFLFVKELSVPRTDDLQLLLI